MYQLYLTLAKSISILMKSPKCNQSIVEMSQICCLRTTSFARPTAPCFPNDGNKGLIIKEVKMEKLIVHLYPPCSHMSILWGGKNICTVLCS
uniref:Uncharacterized protein n=1 Tax=Arundo donax TaxID=35708 RepID=A0A0A8ZGR9_ARUDO